VDYIAAKIKINTINVVVHVQILKKKYLNFFLEKIKLKIKQIMKIIFFGLLKKQQKFRRVTEKKKSNNKNKRKKKEKI